MERKRVHKPPKPLKILVNLFSKSRGRGSGGRKGSAEERSTSSQQHRDAIETQYSPPPFVDEPRSGCLSEVSLSRVFSSHDCVSTAAAEDYLYTELEALHLSRQDNPYVQQVTSLSQEDLLDIGQLSRGGSIMLLSSPEHQPAPGSPVALEEVHSRLVRSPPPTSWPLSPRSTNGTFSPDSSDGLMTSANYYTRSQSEEHILSPCRDLLRHGMHGLLNSPEPQQQQQQQKSPSLLMTSSMYCGGGSSCGGISPRNPREGRVKRNHSREDALGSPFRNIGYDYGATSVSSYALGPPSNVHPRGRSLGARPSSSSSNKKSDSCSVRGFSVHHQQQQQPQLQLQQRRRKNWPEDAKSMENLQVDTPLSLRLPLGYSPSARKSVSSVGTTGGISSCHSPRNSATLFTKWKIKDPTPLYIS